jgi:outer membrane protein assembly factor BamB
MVSFFRPSRWPRGVRYAVTTLAVLTVLGATAVVGYRVLAPAETAVTADGPYPERAAVSTGRYGELTSAPLVVDGRLRIFADARRVWSDAPITAKTERTPYWSYRRWPAEVAGVVAFEGRFEGVALVIVKFSDGVVVALNPRTGRVAWQDRTKPGQLDRFAGRRTAAQTVYQPAGLFTARASSDGASMLIVSGGDEVVGFDPWSGRRLWQQTFTEHPGCHDLDWTGETTYVVKDACEAPAVLRVFDAATGRFLGRWQPSGASAGPAADANWYIEPLSCARGHSGCALFRAAGLPDVTSDAKYGAGVPGARPVTWRVNHDGSITPEPAAVTDHPFLLGETIVEAETISGYPYVHAVSRTNGVTQWRSKEPMARLAAVDHTGVYAITMDMRLVVLHPATGVELSRTDLRKRPNEQWVTGYVAVFGRFVAVERTTGGSPRETDDRYYYGTTPVVIAGV